MPAPALICFVAVGLLVGAVSGKGDVPQEGAEPDRLDEPSRAETAPARMFINSYNLVYGDGTDVFAGTTSRGIDPSDQTEVVVQFVVDDSTIDVTLHRQPSLFVPGAVLQFADGTGTKAVQDLEPPHFKDADGTAVLTIARNGAYVTGVIRSRATSITYEVTGTPSEGLGVLDLGASLNNNAAEVQLGDHCEAQRDTPRGLGTNNRNRRDGHSHPKRSGNTHPGDAKANVSHTTSPGGRQRRTHYTDGQYTPFFGQSSNTCWEGDTTKRTVTIGIFLGTALHSGVGGSLAYSNGPTTNNNPVFAGSDANALVHLTSWFASANNVYEGNLNIRLLMGDIVKGTGSEAWDSCGAAGTKGVEYAGGSTDAGNQLGHFNAVSATTSRWQCRDDASQLVRILPAAARVRLLLVLLVLVLPLPPAPPPRALTSNLSTSSMSNSVIHQRPSAPPHMCVQWIRAGSDPNDANFGTAGSPPTTKYPLFHIFDDCRPETGSYVAGIATTQGLCDFGALNPATVGKREGSSNTGLTYTSRGLAETWIIFAHEVRNNFQPPPLLNKLLQRCKIIMEIVQGCCVLSVRIVSRSLAIFGPLQRKVACSLRHVCCDPMNTHTVCLLISRFLVHQVGHNFAAVHSFTTNADGVITAHHGGLMDYATAANSYDVAYDGIIQFNHELWKDVICENLAYVYSFTFPLFIHT